MFQRIEDLIPGTAFGLVKRVLIFTISVATLHDATPYALKAWLQRWVPAGEV